MANNDDEIDDYDNESIDHEHLCTDNLLYISGPAPTRGLMSVFDLVF